MNRLQEELDLVKKLYVNNGEYDFDDEKEANKFAKELLSNLEEKYSSEGFHHQYESLKDFIYTSHADSEAYWLYEDQYSE